ncbi:ABC transporter permease [Streptomyces antarcticus]|uniref:ABC transporter permease n=1 Tax=Streptomyces antarcticus TaxID=2996458 RepID=UPI002271A48B|nr:MULTISPECIES: ABC transporter permease [unclassified Streptomyces]MCY0940069.1 ABC transporter permease [Streptomyces sp. H34-AA3]MCY0948258.1 ABC transporter permease [Streptomyces sp. H27-S2]MCZ4083733.1 ABC transporter permease [Streptomyces sp. H34-S5]
MTGPTPSGPVPAAATPGATTPGGATGTAVRPAGYSSPLPTPRPHLGHALASEWTKLVSVRSTLWTLGSLVVVVVGIGLLFVAQSSDRDYIGLTFATPALFGLLVGQIAVMVLGVLTITSEHATGLVRTTFTAAPERHRVLTAKYLVFSATAFTVVSAAVFVVGLAGQIVHGGSAAGAHPANEWSGALLGSLYVTLLGILALAVGALIRHSAGAIAVMLGFVTLPPVIGAMLNIWEAAAPTGQVILEHNAPVALMTLFGMQESDVSLDMPGPGIHMLVILVVTGAAVIASYLTVGRRDV